MVDQSADGDGADLFALVDPDLSGLGSGLVCA
jgi:hypothetical protein